MKKIFMIISVLLIYTGSSFATTIKLATLAPEGSPWYNILRKMGDAWKEISDGTVVLKVFAGGIAGDESDMIKKIRVGQLHAAAITGVGLSHITPEVQAMQMPMMMQSYEELDYIFNKVSEKLESNLISKGFKVLNWGDVGWVKFFSQEKAVYPDDLKNQSMFVWGGDTNVIAAWKEAGFKVVPLAPTDILTSLQTRMINAFSTTPLSAASFQWFALAKNMTDMKWAPLIGATVVSIKMWNSIPEHTRAELEKIAKEKEEALKKEVRNLEEEAIKVMIKNGLIVNTIPKEALQVWKSKSKDAYPRLLNTPELKAMYEEVNKYHEEFIQGNKK